MKLIKDLGMKFPKPTSKRKERFGLYECPICLKHFETMTANVNRRHSTKCTSCANRIRSTTHGLTNHPLYEIWSSQKARCFNESDPRYSNYGARGIIVSNEFLDFKVWFEYVTSLDDYGKETYSLDRINNDSGYEKGNLRWASRETQARNTQKIRSDNTSGYRGVSKQGKKWQAQIRVNKKNTYIGIFNTAIEAAHAYDNYVIEHNLEHTKNF